MEYNSAAEYWFYKCLEEGPSFEDKQLISSFDLPAFQECKIAYEWATLLYFEILRDNVKESLKKH